MTRRLRILRVLPFFGAAFGGPVAQAQRVHRELLARGHEVKLLSSDLGLASTIARDAWHERDGVQCFFARVAGLGAQPPYCVPRAAQLALRETLAQVDVATLNVGLSLWGTWLAKSAAKARVPFVYNAEGALDPVRLRVKRLQKQLFLRCCERRVLRRAAAIQAVTAAEADAIVQQGALRERIHVIPNGVLLPPSPVAESVAQLRERGRERLSVPRDAFVILFFGRLHDLKGIDLLLAAAAPLLGGKRDVRLAIVGPEDGVGAALQRQAQALGVQRHVVFHRGVGEGGKAEVFAAADVFALTSRSEGLPNAALEAAAAGLPLLVSEDCHLPEVAEFEAGTICSLEGPTITAALARFRDEAAFTQRCGEGARRMAAARFELGHAVDRLETLYLGLSARA